ncbi:PadR family transcriptional regulator [Arthrobacter sp. MA-N2]|uniref:PadR family transcriptional regulator n=1 Tax=Arthrobacter sp. MA-N2 TaxID=1101188 RepID=UPI003FA47B45
MQTNLRKGVLEYCVLAVIAQGKWYGLDIAQHLHRMDLIASEGSLYPLLSRLRTRGLVTTAWQESNEGPPRRYYSLSSAGADDLKGFIDIWRTFSDSVDRVLSNTTNNEKGAG